jgi:pyridoxine 5-phosphate synthase
MKLGVNIDHIASVRELRKGDFPDPVEAALICERSGCDSVVAHLREDRRHIREQDLIRLKRTLKGKLNLEMSINPDIVDFCLSLRPDQATFVPEKREELTTEGGLDVHGNLSRVRRAADRLARKGSAVSLFIDPDPKQIDATLKAGVSRIELHTGEYASAKTKTQMIKQFAILAEATEYARCRRMHVYAGHGLDYANVKPIRAITGIEELNIGYSIVCRALFIGVGAAVREMKELIR